MIISVRIHRGLSTFLEYFFSLIVRHVLELSLKLHNNLKKCKCVKTMVRDENSDFILT